VRRRHVQPGAGLGGGPVAGGRVAAGRVAGRVEPGRGGQSDISGQTIDVLMPPWAALPQSLLDDFTAKTA
jgi:hypothetical protein